MRGLSYSIKDVDAGVIEVRAHGVKYILQAKDKSGMELTASKDSASESFTQRIKGNVVQLDFADRHRVHLRLKTTVSTTEVRTDASLGRKRFRVKSAPSKHAAGLARAFGKTAGPDVRYIRWFLKDLRQHRAFREDVRIHLPVFGVLNGGPETMYCVAVCACCALIEFDGPIAPACCVACWNCMLE